jgi:hypothetical protein
LSVDPVGVDSSGGSNFNRYNYANGNPYRFTDSDGRSPIEVAFLVADAIELASSISSGEGVGLAALNVVVDIAGVVSPVPGISAAAHAIEGAQKVERAAQLVKNIEQGAKAEKAVAQKIGDQVAGKRVTLEASTGQRSVADLVTKDKSVIEVKSGNSPLSKGQKAVKADIDAGRKVTPRGQNAADAGLAPGKPTTMKCFSVERC